MHSLYNSDDSILDPSHSALVQHLLPQSPVGTHTGNSVEAQTLVALSPEASTSNSARSTTPSSAQFDVLPMYEESAYEQTKSNDVVITLIRPDEVQQRLEDVQLCEQTSSIDVEIMLTQLDEVQNRLGDVVSPYDELQRDGSSRAEIGPTQGQAIHSPIYPANFTPIHQSACVTQPTSTDSQRTVFTRQPPQLHEKDTSYLIGQIFLSIFFGLCCPLCSVMAVSRFIQAYRLTHPAASSENMLDGIMFFIFTCLCVLVTMLCVIGL